MKNLTPVLQMIIVSFELEVEAFNNIWCKFHDQNSHLKTKL